MSMTNNRHSSEARYILRADGAAWTVRGLLVTLFMQEDESECADASRAKLMRLVESSRSVRQSCCGPCIFQTLEIRVENEPQQLQVPLCRSSYSWLVGRCD